MPSSSRKWLVFGAASTAYFFVNFATFASLGVVLFTMAGELHWSMTAAGFSFSLLGLACGLTSTLPTATMKYVGARGSMVVGALLFVFGCLLASVSHSLAIFDVSVAMLGAGYTFAGNIPATILIAQWFERGSARLVGIYLMVGALGAAAAPPVVEFVVRELGWRGHWVVMSGVALIVGILCLAFISDRELSETTLPEQAAGSSKEVSAWTPHDAIRTSQFMVMTAALVLTMAAVTTLNSIVVTHLVKLGSTPFLAAWALGVLSFTGTVMKGAAGHLCETKAPKMFVIAGLLFQAAGCALLIVATNDFIEFTAAIIFGAGWAFALVGGWVVLMNYFGRLTGARVLATVQLLTTAAAAGPIGAGLIADRWGSFAPVLLFYALVLFALVVPVLLMRAPGTPPKARIVQYSVPPAAKPV